MKKLIFFLNLFMVSLIMNAQITITGADMPQPNQAFSVAFKDTPVLSLGSPSGTAQTWDFSGLTSDYPRFAVYSPTAPYHCYAPYFPDADMYTYGPAFMFAGLYGGAPVDMEEWGYCYWSSTNEGLKVIGFRGDYGLGDMNISESPQELLMGAPATYDSVFNNTARWTAQVPESYYAIVSADSATYISTVQKTLTVDAFGSLTTPYGTFDVLRVHEYTITIDSTQLWYTIMGFPVDTTVLFSADTVNKYHFWTNGLGYPVAIVHCDKNNAVLQAEYVTSKDPGYVIRGIVYEPDGNTPVSAGQVSLIGKDPWDHLFGVDETIDIVSGGHFQFSCVTWGNWLVLADPDDGPHPTLFPTYYGDEVAWELSDNIAISSDTNVAIITVDDQSGIISTGNGQISGIVWVDTLNTKTPSNATEAGNVKVTLEENPGGAALMHGKTDDNGEYDFGNLADGNYRMKVEIAGLSMDSTYEITIASGQLVHTNLDFLYDSTLVYVVEGSVVEEISHQADHPVSILPNPFRDNATVRVGNMAGEYNYRFRIIDMQGRVVKDWTGRTSGSFGISAQDLNSGLYLFDLQVDGKIFHSGKVLIERR
ncbi:MAG: T9SS type A sorting domain-containing protein [Bacteroidetes bacterium]|nr:T9SS type A sorting domain-containing protein [Bacteroidota bacterium]